MTAEQIVTQRMMTTFPEKKTSCPVPKRRPRAPWKTFTQEIRVTHLHGQHQNANTAMRIDILKIWTITRVPFRLEKITMLKFSLWDITRHPCRGEPAQTSWGFQRSASPANVIRNPSNQRRVWSRLTSGTEKKLDSCFWSDVAIDHLSARRYNHVLRRPCLMTRLQAFFRGFSSSRWRERVYLCFLTCLHLPTGRYHRCGVSEFSKFPSSFELISSCPTTNSLSLGFSHEGVDITNVSVGSGTWLCPLGWACNHFSSHAMLLCGRNRSWCLGFLKCAILKPSRTRIAPLERHTFEQLLAMDPFVPEFICGVTCTWKIWRCSLSDFFGRPISWNTQPNCVDSFNKATGPFTSLFCDFSLGCMSTSVWLNNDSSLNLHTNSDLKF